MIWKRKRYTEKVTEMRLQGMRQLDKQREERQRQRKGDTSRGRNISCMKATGRGEAP